jgi:alkylhydroperoxidase family enzyme
MSAQGTAAIVRQDLSNAGLTPKERALLEFVRVLTLTPAAVRQTHIAQLRRLGWHDGQIFEAAFEASLFAFFNRIASADGLD